MRSGFEVQKAVVFSLILREIRSRIGKYRLGYLWSLLEPAAHVIVLWSIRSVVMARTQSGISYAVFIIVGVISWFLFRNIAVRSLKMIQSNAGLFGYRFGHKAVKPVDTILAHTLFELVVNILVFAILLYLAWAFLGETVQVNNFPYLATIFLLLAWLALGLALMFVALSERYPESERIVLVCIRPFYFISGVFFSIREIPAEYWPYLYWNPLLHAIELGRNAISPAYDVHQASLGYLFICALVASFVGLALRRTRLKERQGA